MIDDLLADERDLRRERFNRLFDSVSARHWFLPASLGTMAVGSSPFLQPAHVSEAPWIYVLGLATLTFGMACLNAWFSGRKYRKVLAALASCPADEVAAARERFAAGITAPRDLLNLLFALVFAGFVWAVGYKLYQQDELGAACFAAALGLVPLVLLRWQVR
jgi:hypothetical protein